MIKTSQQGFLLPAAIFLLVILSAMGAYALNLSSIQNASSTQDLQGDRAYHAARAGLESMIYQVVTPGVMTLASCPAAITTMTVDAFTVTVTCSQSADYFEQGPDHTIRIYDIQSTATYGAVHAMDRIERQLQASVSKCQSAGGYPCV